MTREIPDEIATLFRRLENRTVEWWGYVNDEHKTVWPRQEEFVRNKNQARKLIEDRLRSSEQRDAEQRQVIAEQRAEIKALKQALTTSEAALVRVRPQALGALVVQDIEWALREIRKVSGEKKERP